MEHSPPSSRRGSRSASPIVIDTNVVTESPRVSTNILEEGKNIIEDIRNQYVLFHKKAKISKDTKDSLFAITDRLGSILESLAKDSIKESLINLIEETKKK